MLADQAAGIGVEHLTLAGAMTSAIVCLASVVAHLYRRQERAAERADAAYRALALHILQSSRFECHNPECQHRTHATIPAAIQKLLTEADLQRPTDDRLA